MEDVTEHDVIEILTRGHEGPPADIAPTIARVLGHGPFKRLALPGPKIGGLKFQPPGCDCQCSLTSFFGDDLARFVGWLESLDGPGRARHQFQIDEFSRLGGRFELPPVYDFEGQLLDGGHRTRAAYYAYLRSGSDSGIALEIVCDIAALV